MLLKPVTPQQIAVALVAADEVVGRDLPVTIGDGVIYLRTASTPVRVGVMMISGS